MQRYIIILIGSLLRSTESFTIKKEMISNIKNFIEKYEEYDISLPLHWKIFVLFIKYRLNLLIQLSSKVINLLFENALFTKIFRNQDYN